VHLQRWRARPPLRWTPSRTTWPSSWPRAHAGTAATPSPRSYGYIISLKSW